MNGNYLLCCECWKPIPSDEAVVRAFAYAVAAYHRACVDAADSQLPGPPRTSRLQGQGLLSLKSRVPNDISARKEQMTCDQAILNR
jgi:hypothetical protein